MNADGSAAARVVIIGAGPAGIMILERLLARHRRDAPELRLDIALVDPYEPGGGRIWRREQSPLLKLNTMLRDDAVFPDESCLISGPIEPGPTLAEWIEQVLAGRIARPEWWDERLETEIRTATDESFPTRRLNSAYLAWAYEEILRRARPEATVTWHRDTAIAVDVEAATVDGAVTGATSAPAGALAREAHIVRLASGERLEADAVVHAVGHNGSRPSAEAERLADFAGRHGLGYVAPAFTADVDFSWVPAGADVIVRGMGLAAVDLVVLLAEGRGGRFARTADGGLRYEPSGREPVVHLGSRRGVPYRSKITSRLAGEPTRLDYLGPAFHEFVAGLDGALDFERDVRPLLSAELLTGYYRELFTAHPARVTGEWERFAAELRVVLAEPGGFRSQRLLELIAAHVPDPVDRFDLDSFDRPLAGPAAASTASAIPHRDDALQQRVLEHIALDLRLRTEQRHSATQGLFMAALHAYFSLSDVPAEKWNARSRAHALPRRWHPDFSYLASGPPGHRLEEIVALHEAGLLRFLGGDVVLETDEERGVFRASGIAATGSGVARAETEAHTLIDAWLPEASAVNSDNPLLRQLVESGQARELAVADEEYAGSTGQLLVGPAGRLPGAGRQFAHGPFTSIPSGGAFTRPGINALPFRLHDRLAEGVIGDLLRMRDRQGSSPDSRQGPTPRAARVP